MLEFAFRNWGVPAQSSISGDNGSWRWSCHTLSIIKPDAVAKNVVGQIYSRFRKSGPENRRRENETAVAKEAEGFYAVHRAGDPFRSKPLVRVHGIRPGGDSSARRRGCRSETSRPHGARPSIPRKQRPELFVPTSHHRSMPMPIHTGSDATETAQVEIAYFFSGTELCAH